MTSARARIPIIALLLLLTVAVRPYTPSLMTTAFAANWVLMVIGIVLTGYQPNSYLFDGAN